LTFRPVGIDYECNLFAMASPSSISEAEWVVMQVLWDEAPQTASDVIARVAEANGWSPKTVKTLLNRLVKKGALRFEAEGKRYRYFPRVTRDECVRRESRTFLSRVFGGEAGSMLAHFVDEAPLTPEEIRRLREALDRRERKGK
jgi:BlaI family penicillinase repressor